VTKTKLGAALATCVALASAAGVIALPAQAATLPKLTLTVSSTSIAVGGATQSGGVNVVTTDTATKEGTAILFRMNPGETAAQVEAALKNGAGKDPNRATKYGTIVFDAEAAPGKSTEAQTSLEPGNYLALGGAEGHGPQFVTPFTVTASPSPAALPTPEATLRSIEFGFRGPSTLHTGELVRFENEGFLVHMDFILPVKSKSAAKAAVKAALNGNEKALGKLIVGEPFGAGPLSHEAFQQMTITAKPGWYVQVCFMETQDGRDHTRLGMERILRIVK
jgi:hypothetical protein